MPLPRIPRISKKKDYISEANQHEAKEVYTIVENAFLYPGNYWNFESVSMIDNPQLNKCYRERKLQIKNESSQKNIPESYVYLSCDNVENIKSHGISVDPDTPAVLGNSKMGVHTFRWADVCLESQRLRQSATSLKLVVLKAILGKSKSVGINISPPLDPTPNYYCHVPSEQAKPTDSFVVAQSLSQVYFYEYNDDMLPERNPRQCLPYAIVTMKYNGPQPVDSYRRFPVNIPKNNAVSKIKARPLVTPLHMISPREGNEPVKESKVEKLKASASFFQNKISISPVKNVNMSSQSDDSDCSFSCKRLFKGSINSQSSSSKPPLLHSPVNFEGCSGYKPALLKPPENSESSFSCKPVLLNAPDNSVGISSCKTALLKTPVNSECNFICKPALLKTPVNAEGNYICKPALLKTPGTSGSKSSVLKPPINTVDSYSSKPSLLKYSLDSKYCCRSKSTESAISYGSAHILKPGLLSTPKFSTKRDPRLSQKLTTSSRSLEKESYVSVLNKKSKSKSLVKQLSNEMPKTSCLEGVSLTDRSEGLYSKCLKTTCQKQTSSVAVKKLSHHLVEKKVGSCNGSHFETSDAVGNDRVTRSVAEKLTDMLMNLPKDVFNPDISEDGLVIDKLEPTGKTTTTAGKVRILSSKNMLPKEALLKQGNVECSGIASEKIPMNQKCCVSDLENTNEYEKTKLDSNSEWNKNVDKKFKPEKRSSYVENNSNSLKYTDDLLNSIFLSDRQISDTANNAKKEMKNQNDLRSKTETSEIRNLADDVLESPASPPVCKESGNYLASPSVNECEDAQILKDFKFGESCRDSEGLSPCKSIVNTCVESFQKDETEKSGTDYTNLEITLESLDDVGKDKHYDKSINDSDSNISFDFEDVETLDEMFSVNDNIKKNDTNKTSDFKICYDSPGLTRINYIDLDSDYSSEEDCFIVDRDHENFVCDNNQYNNKFRNQLEIPARNDKELYEHKHNHINIPVDDKIVNENTSESFLSGDVLDLCSSDEELTKSAMYTKIDDITDTGGPIVIDISDSEYSENDSHLINCNNCNNGIHAEQCLLEEGASLTKQLSSALFCLTAERKRNLSQTSESSMEDTNDMTQIKRRKIKEELKKTCAALRKKVSRDKSQEYFHHPTETLPEENNAIKAATTYSWQQALIYQQATDSLSTENSGAVVTMFDKNHNLEKEYSSFYNSNGIDNDIKNTNENSEHAGSPTEHSYSPNAMFYTKYSYPSLTYKYSPKPKKFSGEKFNMFDRKVCDLYKKFTKYYSKLKRLEYLLKSYDKKSNKYKLLFEKYRKVEMYVAHIHVQLELDVTYYEVAHDPSDHRQSFWQKEEIHVLRQKIQSLEETSSDRIHLTNNEKLVSSLKEEIDDVESKILVPCLPKDSPGNKEKLLCKILQNSGELSKVVFLKKKLFALEKVKDNLDCFNKKNEPSTVLSY